MREGESSVDGLCGARRFAPAGKLREALKGAAAAILSAPGLTFGNRAGGQIAVIALVPLMPAAAISTNAFFYPIRLDSCHSCYRLAVGWYRRTGLTGAVGATGALKLLGEHWSRSYGNYARSGSGVAAFQVLGLAPNLFPHVACPSFPDPCNVRESRGFRACRSVSPGATRGNSGQTRGATVELAKRSGQPAPFPTSS
jgi:hypothetical protein